MKSMFSSRRNKLPHNIEEAEKKKAPFFSKENKTPFFNGSAGMAVQTKLTIGKPGDKYEKEADSMADSVVSNSSKPNIQNKEISSIQRESLASPQEDEKLGTAEQRVEEDKLVQEKPEINKKEGEEEEMVSKKEGEEEEMVSKKEGEEEEMVSKKEGEEEEMVSKKEGEEEEMVSKKEGEEEEMVSKKEGEEEEVQAKGNTAQTASKSLSQQIKSKSGKGKSLAKNTKSEMESSFGVDFSGVNIHTDTDAVKMNKELGAQAFTNGNDIYFNSGKYNPDSTVGKHLLAHELTHTIQQQKNGKKQINMQGGAGLVLPAAGAAVPWSLFWKQVIKRFALRGAVAVGLAAVDGPLPIGDIIALGLSIWIIYDIISLWDILWAAAATAKTACDIGMAGCLDNPWQPDYNKPNFGPRKDCGACYRECMHAGGLWPSYKCP